jgi:hypothetical protein
MVTEVPTGPLVGKKLLIVGGAPLVTSKLMLLVAVPLEVVTTEILPSVAFAGTVALIRLGFTTLKVAFTPLNLTAITPVKLEPLMVTNVPGGPLVGVKLLIVGAPPLVTSKLPLLVAVPFEVVTTEILPSVAPAGTVVAIWLSEFTVKLAAWVLNLTAAAPMKPVPVMKTGVPGGPLVGEKPLIVGATPVTMKSVELLPDTPAVVTEIRPVVAPAGTVVVI